MSPNEALKPRIESTPPRAEGDAVWADRVKKDAEYRTGKKDQDPTEQKLGTWFGDLVRDFRTANQMAKAKFEGDSALMHIARGAITTGVGAGLEKSMDFAWDRVWAGDTPFYDKSKFSAEMAKSLNNFTLKNDITARTSYFMKESTQDLILAIFYNFMAFRGQPILPKTGPEHLVRSLWINFAETMLSPRLPLDTKLNARKNAQTILDEKVTRAEDRWMFIDSKTDRVENQGLEDEKGRSRHTVSYNARYPEQAKAAKDAYYSFVNQKTNNTERLHNLTVDQDRYDKAHPQIATVDTLVRSVTGISNPVTHLGIEWLAIGVKTLMDNIKEVRKVRGERGGLAGKSVHMQTKDKYPSKRDSFHKDGSRGYDSRRREDRRGNEFSKKVYFGQGASDQPLTQEEYDLKMDS